MASTSSRKGMLRGKAGEVSWDPDQEEPSVISGNGNRQKFIRRGMTLSDFHFRKMVLVALWEMAQSWERYGEEVS